LSYSLASLPQSNPLAFEDRVHMRKLSLLPTLSQSASDRENS
jgi:hypothetical protein